MAVPVIEDPEHAGSSFVFVHGVLGFARFTVGRKRIDYFRRLPPCLGTRGYDAFFPQLPPAESIVNRAQALAQFLSGIAGNPLCIVAHSMGGLDARYLIHRLDPERRVRCLVTVGTPHRGSLLAAWFLNTRGPLQWAGRRLAERALVDLTPESCARFNERVPNRSDVRYLSYAGARPIEEMPCVFRPSTRLLEEEAGQNDSQVPVASAQWGEFQGTVRASHTELIGWSFAWPDRAIARPFDHLGFYATMLSEVVCLVDGIRRRAR